MMIRKRASWAFLICLLFQACSHNRDQAKRSALKRGEQFFQKGRFAEAEIQFRKALQEDPRFGDAYLALGRTESRLGNYSFAFDSLRQAIVTMPGQEGPKIELGNFLLVSYLANPSHPAEAYKQISEISNELLARNSDSFDGIRFKAYLATLESDSSKAVEYFEQANRLRPDQRDIITALCESLIRAGNKDRAEKTAREFLQKQPGYGPIYTMLYQYYVQAGRPADAEAILRSKVANNPREGLYRIELARHYSRVGKTAESSAVLSQLLGDAKAFPRAHLDLGDFYMESRNWAEARRQYTDGAQSDTQSRVVYWKRLVRADLAMNDQAAAQRALEQILKDEPDDAETQASRSALRMASNDPAQRKLAVSEFKAIVDRMPKVVDYRYQYAEALRGDGQSEAAREQYLLVVQRQPQNLAALHTLAELSIRGQHLDEALTYADRILALHPGDVAAILVRSAALASKGRLVETRSILTSLAKEHPELREAQLQLGLLDVAQRHYAEAEARFRKQYAPGKGDVRSLEGLVEVYRAQNQLDRAVTLLRQDLEKGPQFNEVRALLAKTAVQAGMKELAVAEYEQLARAETESVSVALQLGLAYQANGDPVRAVGEFERANKMAPQNSPVYAFLGKALDDAGRKSDAIVSYRQSLALDRRNPWVMNNLAYLLAETGGDLDAALKLAQSAVRESPGNAGFSDTLGFIYLKRKNFQSAIHTFQGVRDQYPKDAGFRTHLGEALLDSGDRSQGRSELTTALALASTPEERNRVELLLRSAGQGR
jgi:Flp pilus assembly protein TadD